MYKTNNTVVNCYDFLDRIFPESEIFDLTEGIYHDDPSTPYEEAQHNQLNWILDQLNCKEGSRILDIGCGNGTLIEEAKNRGATAVGITISPNQVSRCRQRDLDVRLLNYRNIGNEWNGRFDGIVANGSIEHFVRPEDAMENNQDTIYRELFELCHRLLDPHSSSKRFVTTVIHTCENTPEYKLENLVKSPFRIRWFSDQFHIVLLQRTMGGYYPSKGQLEKNATPLFTLIKEVDGTYDYHLTSEQWLNVVRRSMLHWKKGPKIFLRLLVFSFKHPIVTFRSVFCFLIAESWQRQFRNRQKGIPFQLLRHVWQYN